MTGFEWQEYIEVEDAPVVFKSAGLLTDEDIKKIETEQDIVELILSIAESHPAEYEKEIQDLKREWDSLPI